MENQNLILEKYSANKVMDELNQNLLIIQKMITNASTEEDFNKMKVYFNFVLENSRQEIESIKISNNIK